MKAFHYTSNSKVDEKCPQTKLGIYGTQSFLINPLTMCVTFNTGLTCLHCIISSSWFFRTVLFILLVFKFFIFINILVHSRSRHRTSMSDGLFDIEEHFTCNAYIFFSWWLWILSEMMMNLQIYICINYIYIQSRTPLSIWNVNKNLIFILIFLL